MGREGVEVVLKNWCIGVAFVMTAQLPVCGLGFWVKPHEGGVQSRDGSRSLYLM